MNSHLSPLALKLKAPKPLSVMERALPAPNPTYRHISSQVASGPSRLRAAVETQRSVARGRGEFFARIKPRALLELLEVGIPEEEGESGSIAHAGGGDGGGDGALRLVTVDASSAASPLRWGRGSTSADLPADFLILDVRPSEE